MKRVIFLVLLVWSAGVQGQEIPAGWKVVKDAGQTCQMAVPGAWTVAELSGKQMGSASSPDRNNMVTVHGTRSGMTFSENRSMIQQALKPSKIFEDSSSRLFYEYPPLGGNGSTNWYIAVPGKGNVCAAQISFVGNAPAADAKKIALSVSAAK